MGADNLVGLQRRIYEIVKRASPERISTSEIAGMIYGNRVDGGPEWANSTVRRLIFEINKKIKPERLSGKPGRSSSGYVLVKKPTEWEAMWSKPFQWPQYL